VPPTFALDENFPLPLVTILSAHLPFGIIPLADVDAALVGGIEDWELLVGLHRHGLDGLITTDFAMLELPKEMAVLHQTKLTVVAIEGVTHNPLVAVGELLVHAPHIGRQFQAQIPQVFRIPRRRLQSPLRPWDLLGEIASPAGVSIMQLFDAHKEPGL
jgi:hypothetical protein